MKYFLAGALSIAILSGLACLFLMQSASHAPAPAPVGPAAVEGVPREPQPAPQLPVAEPTYEELAAAQIEDILNDMTTEEMVGQLFFPRCPVGTAIDDIESLHVGGFILFGRDFQDADGNWLTEDQVIDTIAGYQSVAQVPLLIGVDEEGGTVARVSRNPYLCDAVYPSPQELQADNPGDETCFYCDSFAKCSTLLHLGINVNLAPVADVSTDSNDFIYARTLGGDAQETARFTRGVVLGAADAGVGSVLKHFPGYGNNVDTHTGIAVDERPYEQFVSEDFLPFISGIDAGEGTSAVMVSHNIMTSVDEDLPASLSYDVHQVLRDELDFDGVIMTDDLAMDAVAAYAQDGSVAVMALQAGNDLVVTTDYQVQIPYVVAAVEDGILSENQVREACKRVLTWKQSLGLLEPIE